MEPLPLTLLQFMLLPLSSAPFIYFWDVNGTIAFVVLDVSSFGVVFYFFIVVAATASVSEALDLVSSALPDEYLRLRTFQSNLVYLSWVSGFLGVRGFCLCVHTRFLATMFIRLGLAPGQQVAVLGLRCLSWMLHTSLDEGVHLVTRGVSQW